VNRHDIASGTFWLAISIFALIKAIQLGVGAFSNPGPGFVFFWSGTILGLLSIILVVKGLMGKEKPRKLADSFRGLKWYQPLVVTIALFAYGAFLNVVGFLLATFLMLILFYGLGRPGLWTTVGCALVTVLVTYVTFHYGLQIQFPRGILAF
jgi:hypothetical protein